MKIKNNIEEIINLYKNGISSNEIAKHFNCSAVSILYWLNKKNIIRRNNSDCQRKYSLQQNYFNEINSEDKAYFLGLLFADGYNLYKENKLVLQLHEQDIDILNKFKKALKTNKPFKEIKKNKTKYIRLSINSKIICEALNRLGCIQAKTFKILFPKNLKENLFKHFIRGYFDGDGNIYIDKKGQPEFSLTGNKKFINKIHKYLCKILKLNQIKIKKKNNSYTMRFRGKNVCKIIYDYLYLNSNYFMERKFQKFSTIQ